MESTIRTIVLIEDDEIFSQVLRMRIDSLDLYHVKAVYNNCEEALVNIKKDAPDIILIDIDLPGINGIQGTYKIKQCFPTAEIVILTVYNNKEKVFNALCAGAVGYLTKDCSINTLLESLEEIRFGGAPMSIDIARMVVNSFSKNTSQSLSPKETEVIKLLSEGKSYKSISNLTKTSINTIKFHIKNIYGALQVNTREAAVEMAKKHNWI